MYVGTSSILFENLFVKRNFTNSIVGIIYLGRLSCYVIGSKKHGAH